MIVGAQVAISTWDIPAPAEVIIQKAAILTRIVSLSSERNTCGVLRIRITVLTNSRENGAVVSQ